MNDTTMLALVFLAMGLVTYGTRAGGVLLMRFVPLTPAIERFLRSLSSCVLVAVLAPAAVHGDLATRVTLVAAAAVMALTRNALAAMGAGVVAAMMVRHLPLL